MSSYTGVVHQACDLVVDSSPDRKPVQLAQHMRDVITAVIKLKKIHKDPFSSFFTPATLLTEH